MMHFQVSFGHVILLPEADMDVKDLKNPTNQVWKITHKTEEQMIRPTIYILVCIILPFEL